MCACEVCMCWFADWVTLLSARCKLKTNSYVSLKSVIIYELLYTKFYKFRDKVFLYILNESFPRMSEYTPDTIWKQEPPLSSPNIRRQVKKTPNVTQ